MCIFWPNVRNVASTKIFARMSSTGSQFLVYEMKYDSGNPTAMILPIPVKQPAGDDGLRFIDLSNAKSFFEELEDLFPELGPQTGFGCSMGRRLVSKSAALPVIEVGSFVASFVPTRADFTRLDEQFRIPDSAWKSLSRYDDFGFAVFQLREGRHEPHPMAFEFSTRLEKLFFPTVHMHHGKVPPREEFDHILYAQHSMFDRAATEDYRGSRFQQALTGLVRSATTPIGHINLAATRGIVDGSLLVHRRIMRGEFANEDVKIAIPEEAAISRQVWLNRLTYLPYALVAGLGAWLIGRRIKLKNKISETISRDH